MKLKIRHETKERKYLSRNSYQNVLRDVELEPVKIVRTQCGIGAAENRYFYRGYFPAPIDAEFVTDGLINVNIVRKLNPQFKPKTLDWANNICLIV